MDAWKKHSRNKLSLQIVFSKMVWVGSKEENPKEKELPVPEDLKEAPEGDNRGTVVFGQGLGSCLLYTSPSPRD